MYSGKHYLAFTPLIVQRIQIFTDVLTFENRLEIRARTDIVQFCSERDSHYSKGYFRAVARYENLGGGLAVLWWA